MANSSQNQPSALSPQPSAAEREIARIRRNHAIGEVIVILFALAMLAFMIVAFVFIGGCAASRRSGQPSAFSHQHSEATMSDLRELSEIDNRSDRLIQGIHQRLMLDGTRGMLAWSGDTIVSTGQRETPVIEREPDECADCGVRGKALNERNICSRCAAIKEPLGVTHEQETLATVE